MSYTFTADEPVVIVSEGAVVNVLTVRGQEHGIVTLDDGSRWYAASGLPVAGAGNRRLTVLTHALAQQLNKRAALLRIAELATIVTELTDLRNRVSEADLERAEGALRQLLRGRANMLPPRERDGWWARIDERLDEAARGAVQRLKDDHRR